MQEPQILRVAAERAPGIEGSFIFPGLDELAQLDLDAGQSADCEAPALSGLAELALLEQDETPARNSAAGPSSSLSVPCRSACNMRSA